MNADTVSEEYAEAHYLCPNDHDHPQPFTHKGKLFCSLCYGHEKLYAELITKEEWDALYSS